jgi:hypothetical protein
MPDKRWPPLPYDEWHDTLDTLHMWTQIVGKVALECGPRLNHCWGVALQVTIRGLSTQLLRCGDWMFAIEFDFIAHRLTVQRSDGEQRVLDLHPRSVADFYRELMAALDALQLPVRIRTMPAELPPGMAIRFEEDVVHHAYDREYVNRFWRILLAVSRQLTDARRSFVGKASPAHFFWGSLDVALTRFSGRLATPPPSGPPFMCDAYSHEVISHGFWPGNQQMPEAAFYAYAAPTPPDLATATIQPSSAYYRRDPDEFILPYEAMRTAANPDAALVAFVETTYAEAARVARWDRAALERTASDGVSG